MAVSFTATDHETLQSYAGLVEQDFRANEIVSILTNARYQGDAEGATRVHAVRSDTSNLTSTIQEGFDISPAALQEVNAEEVEIVLNRNAPASFKIGRDAVRDSIGAIVEDARRKTNLISNSAVEKDILQYMYNASQVPSGQTFTGGVTYRFTAGNEGTPASADDQERLFEDFHVMEWRLTRANKMRTSQVDRQFWCVMHPDALLALTWGDIKRDYAFSRKDLIERGDELNNSRLAYRIFGFDVYTSTFMEQEGTGANVHSPILFGTRDAVTVAQAYNDGFIYPPGSVQGTFEWRAEYNRRFGRKVVEDSLLYKYRLPLLVTP